MAVLSDSGTAYTLGGTSTTRPGVHQYHNREDLADFITNISPTKTPFLSGIGQVPCKAITHEWLSHSLAAAVQTGVVEGNEASLTTPTTLTRLYNWCQINQKAVAISGTQDVVSKAGMGTELAYRVLLHTKEIKRDMESAAVQNITGSAGGPSTARSVKGFEGWVTTNTASYTTGITWSESLINTELNAIWTAGGDPDTILVGGNLKQQISGFTTGVTKNLNAQDRRLTTAVDVYESDFGVLKVVPSQFCNTTIVHIMESDMWKLAVLRPLAVEPLGKSGDTTKRLLTVEWTLESRAENANGAITKVF